MGGIRQEAASPCSVSRRAGAGEPDGGPRARPPDWSSTSRRGGAASRVSARSNSAYSVSARTEPQATDSQAHGRHPGPPTTEAST